tara:strand:- start:49 stop:420 length:372 start_codon:yes stop_codon:yes gene_type:complete
MTVTSEASSPYGPHRVRSGLHGTAVVTAAASPGTTVDFATVFNKKTGTAVDLSASTLRSLVLINNHATLDVGIEIDDTGDTYILPAGGTRSYVGYDTGCEIKIVESTGVATVTLSAGWDSEDS